MSLPNSHFIRGTRRVAPCAALSLLLPIAALCAPVAPAADGTLSSGGCHAALQGNVLSLGNGRIERAWRIEPDGQLTATSLFDATSRTEWISTPEVDARRVNASLVAEDGKAGPTEAPSFRATLTVAIAGAKVLHTFQVFPNVNAVAAERTLVPAGGEALPATTLARLGTLESFVPAAKEPRITAVRFHGKTDLFEGPLVVERPVNMDPIPDEDLDAAHTSDWTRFRGNVFFLEDPKTAAGVLFLKHAPLPDERSRAIDGEGVLIHRLFDFSLRRGRVELLSHELAAAGGRTYRTATVVYQGGRAGRISALQAYHRSLRVYAPNRDGLLLCNAWGEWNSSQNLSRAFLDREIPAASRLGVDVFQIDAGWQTATYPKQLDRKLRDALGHYGMNPNYWSVHPTKFPDGLGAYVAQMKAHGMQAGIWFPPDSANELAQAARDKARVLELYRDGFTHFKFDLLRIYTPRAEERFQALVEDLLRETDGGLTIDLDVTGGHTPRPGYFGNPHHGPMFVENRWTHYPPQSPEPTNSEYWPRKDRYWPHRTLRNLWLLSQYMDPIRLRMEFMNNLRQQDKYGDDPLAPGQWSPAYVFATVMCSSPLAWMEVQQLPETYVRQVAPLIAVWKAHREKLFGGSVIPIGAEPNGHAWTGFLSVNERKNGGYALLYRELNDQPHWETQVPLLEAGDYDAVVLAGAGKVSVAGGSLVADLPDARQFVFVELRKK